MKYYCYVYYDENWQAYYVGKGVGGRMYCPKDHPELPPKERIQRFSFAEEWQAYECEIELIAFWGRQCDGGCLLNKSTGGPGAPGAIRSAETRAKMSAAHKGNQHCKGRKLSAETRAKLSAAHTGKKLSTEHRAKISAAQKGKQIWKGKKHSAEAKAKMSAAQTGKKLSAETRAKKSAAMKEYWRRIKEDRV